MVSKIDNEFLPDYLSPPGETLEETLGVLGMSQAELAQRTGRPKKTINEIIQGKTAITPETAIQFERVLNISADFWLRLEQQYREDLARLQDDKLLQTQTSWLDQIPVGEMANLGWISSFTDKLDQLKEVLRFFAVASVEQWKLIWEEEEIAFRRAAKVQENPYALSAWLRRGEIEAQKISCLPYNGQKFQQILREIRALTCTEPDIFCPALVEKCASAGIAVVFVPELTRTGVSGATRWLNPDKALIQLSLRYKRDDQLWFSFFHEAGHILLHGKRDIFLEGNIPDNEKEKQADIFAADSLIAPKDWMSFTETNDFRSMAVIKSFAEEIGIAPGIVVGRLQYEKRIPFANCNELKRAFEWQGIEVPE